MELTAGDLAAWEKALADLDRDGQAERWAADAVAWVEERLGEETWSLQAEIMRSVRDNPRTAVPACHGPGKSHIASRVIGHFIDTKPLGDAFVVTSAPTANQVRAILWRYIRRMHKNAGLPGNITQGMVPEWKIDGELVGFGRKPADYDEDAFQGMHDLELLVVLDEACGVPEQLWNAGESLMTNADTCRFLAIGNPTSTSSFFYKVCTTEPGWNIIKISAYDTPNLTGEPVSADLARRLVSREWVEDKVIRWGRGSPLFKAKVLGEFSDDAAGIIPLAWVEAAQYRWQEWHDNPVRDSEQPHGRTVLGVDVGHEGEDPTVIAERKGEVVVKIEEFAQTDTIQTTTLTEARLTGHVRPLAVVDGIGVGAGVVDLLRKHGHDVLPFIASYGTKKRDVTGALKFNNWRSAAWWNVRERLDPSQNPSLCLPPDDDLTAELIAPRWEERAGGVIVVEAKDEIRRRLGRSTNKADSVVQCLWTERPPRSKEPAPTQLRALEYADAEAWRDY